MLIVSDFFDYYDRVKAFGIDKTIVYQRKTSLLELHHPKYKDNDQLSHGWYGFGKFRACQVTEGVLGFCGNLYPLLFFKRTNHPTIIAYDEESALIEIRKFGEDHLPGRRFLDHTSVYERNWAFLLPIFQEYKVPCFLHRLEPNDNHTRQRQKLVTELNPRLKDLGFVAIKDPPTAFQEISQYISGVLGTGEKQTVTIDDKHKAIAHGHDGKYSFRTEPGRGKGNRPI